MMRVILVENMEALNEIVPDEETIVQVNNEGMFRMNEQGNWEKLQIYNE